MPFAGYKDFDACVAANGDKGDPNAYCGYIKHRVEGGFAPRTAAAPAWVKQAEREILAASTLPYQHEVVDPNNAEVPQADKFETGTMFPLNPAFQGEWETSPGGAVPKGSQKQAGMAASGATHRLFGRGDALDGRQPRHKEDYSGIFSDKGHGQYLRAYNEVAGTAHAVRQRTPWTRQQYGEMTGRPDLYKHYFGVYSDVKARQESPFLNNLPAGVASRRTADFMTRPHQTTDDFNPPYNSAATTPQPFPGENSSDGDYQAGFKDGQEDARSGTRPTFMDNSSKVSGYVKGYAEGYSRSAPQFGTTQDTPMSMGGDSGQAANAQEAGTAFQVSKASLRASAAFVTDEATADRQFARGYDFARNWKTGGRLPGEGTPAFEAGLYAGITDNPGHQLPWMAEHRKIGHRALRERLSAHEDFTRQYAQAHPEALVRGFYVQAGTSTDLITDGPGSSPDPMGSTPLNGPGTPPPDGGKGNPARSGGASPYQGAEPHGGGPAVSDDVVGPAQEPPKADGKPQMGFSGPGKGYTNINLAPVAPNQAAGPGYSNPDADQGNPHHDGTTAAFRSVVQANLRKLRERQPA